MRVEVIMKRTTSLYSYLHFKREWVWFWGSPPMSIRGIESLFPLGKIYGAMREPQDWCLLHPQPYLQESPNCKKCWLGKFVFFSYKSLSQQSSDSLPPHSHAWHPHKLPFSSWVAFNESCLASIATLASQKLTVMHCRDQLMIYVEIRKTIVFLFRKGNQGSESQLWGLKTGDPNSRLGLLVLDGSETAFHCTVT